VPCRGRLGSRTLKRGQLQTRQLNKSVINRLKGGWLQDCIARFLIYIWLPLVHLVPRNRSVWIWKPNCLNQFCALVLETNWGTCKILRFRDDTMQFLQSLTTYRLTSRRDAWHPREMREHTLAMNAWQLLACGERQNPNSSPPSLMPFHLQSLGHQTCRLESHTQIHR